MSFVDKAKDAAEKFKNSDNEQVNKVKDQINEYTGGEKHDNKDKKMTNKALPNRTDESNIEIKQP